MSELFSQMNEWTIEGPTNEVYILLKDATDSICDRFQLSLPVIEFSTLPPCYLAISFLGFVGNTLMIIVVRKGTELKKTTNYFIVNERTVSPDFVVLISVLAETVQSTFWQWPTGSTAVLV